MSVHKARLRNIVGFALAVLVWLADPVPSVQADGCGAIVNTPTPSVAERTTAAPIVLEGIVTTLNGNDAEAVAGVQVRQYLKGGGPALVYISGFHKFWTLYDCPDWVNIGDHLIFYAARFPEGGKLHTFVVGERGSTTPASSDFLEEAILVAGQRPVTPEPQTEVPPSTETLTPSAAAGSRAVTPSSEVPPSTETLTPSAAQGSRAVTPSSSTLVTMALIFSGLIATVAVILLVQSLYTQNKKPR